MPPLALWEVRLTKILSANRGILIITSVSLARGCERSQDAHLHFNAQSSNSLRRHSSTMVQCRLWYHTKSSGPLLCASRSNEIWSAPGSVMLRSLLSGPTTQVPKKTPPMPAAKRVCSWLWSTSFECRVYATSRPLAGETLHSLPEFGKFDAEKNSQWGGNNDHYLVVFFNFILIQYAMLIAWNLKW